MHVSVIDERQPDVQIDQGGKIPASICSRVGLIECLPLLRMRGRRTRRNFRSSRCPARLCSSDWVINSFNRIPRRAASAFTRLKRASGKSTVVRIKAYSHNCRGWQSIRRQRLAGDWPTATDQVVPAGSLPCGLQRGQSTNLDRRSDSREQSDARRRKRGQVDCGESRPPTLSSRIRLKNRFLFSHL